MDIRWKNYSHALVTKIIVFLIAMFCFSSALTTFISIGVAQQGNFEVAFEESYYQGIEYLSEVQRSLRNLLVLKDLQSEEHILSGGTVTAEKTKDKEDSLFRDFEYSRRYNHNLSYAENYELFQDFYAEELAKIKDRIIKEDLAIYTNILQQIKNKPGLLYYVSDGVNEITNSPHNLPETIEDFPAYMIFEGAERQVKTFPSEVLENRYYYWLGYIDDELGAEETIYFAFTEDYLKQKIAEWHENKALMERALKQIVIFSLVLGAAFIYLLVVIGRKPEEEGIALIFVDKIYTDFNVALCLALIISWFVLMEPVYLKGYIHELIFPLTFAIGSLGLILVLSLVKHLKNGTFIKHSLTYTIFYKIFKFIQDIYNSGSTAVKVVLLTVGYPLLVAATFFIFPITLGIGAWLTLKKVKEFKAIREGVERIKAGNVQHKIDVPGDGEFAKLARDINGIAEGLNKAVANELKSERLKAELITNVSHDIRTPLTSIITYVDLLKQEEDQEKAGEYLEIIDQKAQRLKNLTDDLFEATKASSGNIPVNFEKIDLIALITQGLGELDDKITDAGLEFRINSPEEKLYVNADGKQLWRAIENLLANILKYSQHCSRVYIDIDMLETFIRLTFKNISAHELNISPDHLMERFTRGDEARSTQGSGLGLSIAKSLIELQKGSFKIEIDGDLFKAIMTIPKFRD